MDNYSMSSHMLYKTLYNSNQTSQGTPIEDFKKEFYKSAKNQEIPLSNNSSVLESYPIKK